MLPRQYRLPRTIIRLKGKVVSTTNALYIYSPNKLSSFRVRIVISKKSQPSAVLRHKLNRRLHHLLRDQLAHLEPLDLVIIITPKIFQLDYPQLKIELTNLLKRTSIQSQV